jgi:hypothetical protein
MCDQAGNDILLLGAVGRVTVPTGVDHPANQYVLADHPQEVLPPLTNPNGI